MKKYIKKYVCTGLVLLIFMSLFVQFTSAETSKPILLKGMRSAEVTTLQSNLKKLGYFNQEPTGYFGDVTETAVKKFQKDCGLSDDGKVGTNTYNKIDILLNRPVLKKGVSSQAVTALQNDLKKLKYFNQEPTGYFGGITETAVKTLQSQCNLTATGIVDTLTYTKIDYLLNKPGNTNTDANSNTNTNTNANANSIKVVIDPGHGGLDIGTSKGGVIESEVNLDISKKLRNYLEQDGYSTVLTRDKDIALDSLSSLSDTRERRDLNARTNIINGSQAKMFVSIHVNSYPDSASVSGSVVYYNDKLPKSKLLAQNIQKALNNISVTGFKRDIRDCQKADYYVLRNSNIPGVLVETAFVTNDKERALLSTDAFREQIAKAVVSAIKSTDLK